MRAVAKLTLALYLCVEFALRLSYCQYDEDNTERKPDKVQCVENLPEIYVSADYLQFYIKKDQEEIVTKFVNYLTVTCSAVYGTNLVLTKDGDKLRTTNEDQSVITWSTSKPGILKSNYTCINTETDCKRSVIVAIIPALQVLSPKLQTVDDKFHTNYNIQYGSSMTVLCSGPAAARLALTKDGDPIITEYESNTTIKWFVRKPDLQISEIVCIDLDTAINSSVLIRVEPFTYITSQNEIIEPDFTNLENHTRIQVYRFPYNHQPVEVFCCGPRTVRLLSPDDNKELISESVNNTVVRALIRNSKIGTTLMSCADNKQFALMSIVHVVVTPQMEVKSSSNIRYVGNRYVMRNGDPLEIICSSPDIAQITIYKKEQTIEKLQTINGTSLRWFERKKHGAEIYSCFIAEIEAYVTVDTLPEAMEFRCMSHNMEYINCTWMPSTANIQFALYYFNNREHTRLCKKSHAYHEMFCIWYSSDYPGYLNDVSELSFLTQSCNNFGCSNQTFHIDHVSIVRPVAPQGLRIHSITSRGAVIRWDSTYMICAGKSLRSSKGDFLYKVEYLYSGTNPLEANSSLVTCYLRVCEMKLTLPCAGQFYEVRIYQRLKRAVGEELWSDFSSISFHTVVDYEDVADSTCNWEPRKTKEVMTYFTQMLRKETRLEMQQIKEKIRMLKKKATRLHTDFKR
ncbi:uncharacterized protein LOC134793256 [Cydia splendana]|uniref:uncharacterized protein LOC134793256 n=1 Tax=Cydia splendana TaxID=1100963 RepID=UPI00300C9676